MTLRDSSSCGCCEYGMLLPLVTFLLPPPLSGGLTAEPWLWVIGL